MRIFPLFPTTSTKQRCYVEAINDDIYIPSDATVTYILEKIFNLGFERGVERGKQDKIYEIKKALQIEDKDD